MCRCVHVFFFFSSRRRHTRCLSDWSSDVCSSDLALRAKVETVLGTEEAPSKNRGKRNNTEVFMGSVYVLYFRRNRTRERRWAKPKVPRSTRRDDSGGS